VPINRNIHREISTTSILAQNNPCPKPMTETSRSDGAHLLGLVEDVGEVALAAVLTVVHGSHEDTGTAL
jgi:hypothetical protein